jgi:hypothetical protein
MPNLQDNYKKDGLTLIRCHVGDKWDIYEAQLMGRKIGYEVVAKFGKKGFSVKTLADAKAKCRSLGERIGIEAPF